LKANVKGIRSLFSWRAFQNERETHKASQFIDGDLIESFLSLEREKMQEVVDGKSGGMSLGAGVTVDDLIRQVEEMVRLH
jgi:DNA damage-binding protein 1